MQSGRRARTAHLVPCTFRFSPREAPARPVSGSVHGRHGTGVVRRAGHGTVRSPVRSRWLRCYSPRVRLERGDLIASRTAASQLPSHRRELACISHAAHTPRRPRRHLGRVPGRRMTAVRGRSRGRWGGPGEAESGQRGARTEQSAAAAVRCAARACAARARVTRACIARAVLAAGGRSVLTCGGVVCHEGSSTEVYFPVRGGETGSSTPQPAMHRRKSGRRAPNSVGAEQGRSRRLEHDLLQGNVVPSAEPYCPIRAWGEEGSAPGGNGVAGPASPVDHRPRATWHKGGETQPEARAGDSSRQHEPKTGTVC